MADRRFFNEIRVRKLAIKARKEKDIQTRSTVDELMAEAEKQMDGKFVDAAFKLLFDAAQLEPRNFHVHFLLAKAYEAYGIEEDAKAEYRIARELALDLPESQQTLYRERIRHILAEYERTSSNP